MIRHRLAYWVLSAALLIAASVHAAGGFAATSSTVVSATVPSAITLADDCGSRSAWSFGTVLPGTPALTATGAGVCRFTFGSSNDSSMLRLYQADTSGTAMVGAPSTWSVLGGDAVPNRYMVDGFGASLVYAVDSTNGSGRYRWSVDGGATWSLDMQGGTTLRLVSVPSATVAWRFGNSGVQRSNDAAALPGPPTWSAVSREVVGAPPAWTAIDDADAVDYNTAWIVNNSTAYRTVNPLAAEPWEPSGTGCSNPEGLDALDAMTAFVGGTGRVCRTTNGGASWSTLTTGITPGLTINDLAISPQTSTTIWAVGLDGSVFRSVDNGATWGMQSLPIAVPARQLTVLSDAEAFVGAVDGQLYHTTTSGATWMRVRIPTTSDLDSMHVATASTLVVTTEGSATFHTSDGGASWSQVLGGTTDTLLDVDARDDDVIIAAKGNGVVRITDDGGSSWTDSATGLAPDNIRGVALVDSDSFIAVGDQGGVAVTEDAGATWSIRVSGTTDDLWDVDVAPNGTAIAVGDGGTILRSVDRGWNWTVVASSGAGLRAVSIRSGGLVIAGGLSGSLRRSGNDGVTWTSPASGTTLGIEDIAVASPTVAYATVLGSLLKSTDAGVTWNSTATGAAYEHLGVVTEDIVWVFKNYNGGWAQFALRSTDGGATWSSPFGNQNPSVRAVVAIDGGRVLFASHNDYVRISDPGAAIANYSGGAWTAATSQFGGCLQDVGGAATEAAWTEDASGIPGQCEAADTDPWYAVPIAPTKVAQMVGPGTGSVDLVWGFRPSSSQSSGIFTAGIVIEAIAPNS